MKKLSFLFFLLLASVSYAQFTSSNVQYFIGEGSQVAYLVVDFKDGTDDRCYAWGIRFNPGELTTGEELLEKVAIEEPAFEYDVNGGFLDAISFNAHSEMSGDDWWSLWVGTTAADFGSAGWMGGAIENGMWYGASYGFMNPEAEAPVEPIAAYHSLWLSNDDITTWYGTGANKSVIIIDFGSGLGEDADSYTFGVKYDGASITAEAALELLSGEVAGFTYTTDEDGVTAISWNGLAGTTGENGSWKNYSGTNLSNWKTEADLSSISLSNGQWLGLGFGERRPYMPQNTDLGLPAISDADITIYPNPAQDVLHLKLAGGFDNAEIYDLAGKMICTGTSPDIAISNLNTGIYILKIKLAKSVIARKFVKK